MTMTDQTQTRMMLMLHWWLPIPEIIKLHYINSKKNIIFEIYRKKEDYLADKNGQKG